MQILEQEHDRLDLALSKHEVLDGAEHPLPALGGSSACQ